ncbi:hypothetical protein [Calothrix sp. CCY 0018]|uniref:hypothetical protein n=1 Tax=Calothrix sp. CCY 0018 TaxID=3103864 RepID=UPI0039C6C1DC
MLKKIAAVISTFALMVPVIEPANASVNRTKVIAQVSCSNEGFVIVNPEYYGRTRSGLDIWICIETGYGRQAFTMYNPGPYPVLACNMIECRMIDMTY